MNSRNNNTLSILLFLMGCIALYFVLFTNLVFDNTFSFSEISSENTATNEIDALYSASELEELKIENDQLKELLSYTKEEKYKVITAPVIGRDIDLYNALTIGAGTNHGVSLNDVVMIGKGNFIGKIIAVSQYRSTVLLLNDPSLSVTVKKLGTTDSLGITKGLLGAGVSVDLIPKDTTLADGDIIVIRSEDASIPDGLVVGKVTRIFESDNQLFNQASVSPLVDVYDFNIVGIIIK